MPRAATPARPARTDAPLESTLEDLLIHQVRTRLMGRAVKFLPLEKGCPDRLIMLPTGRLYLVELKRDRPHGRVSPRQELWHERAAKMGITVHVLYGARGILAWVKERTERWDQESLCDTTRGPLRCRGYVTGGKRCAKNTEHTSGYCPPHRSQH